MESLLDNWLKNNNITVDNIYYLSSLFVSFLQILVFKCIFLNRRKRENRILWQRAKIRLDWISQSNGSIGHPLGFLIDRQNTSASLYRIAPCLRCRFTQNWVFLYTLFLAWDQKKKESSDVFRWKCTVHWIRTHTGNPVCTHLAITVNPSHILRSMESSSRMAQSWMTENSRILCGMVPKTAFLLMLLISRYLLVSPWWEWFLDWIQVFQPGTVLDWPHSVLPLDHPAYNSGLLLPLRTVFSVLRSSHARISLELLGGRFVRLQCIYHL